LKGLKEVIAKYKLRTEEERDIKKLEVGNSPFHILLIENKEYKVRIGVDKDKLDELIQEMIDEGNPKEDISDALDEMLDETLRIAYDIITALERMGYEVKSELTSSVMDIKDLLAEELEYLEEIS